MLAELQANILIGFSPLPPKAIPMIWQASSLALPINLTNLMQFLLITVPLFISLLVSTLIAFIVIMCPLIVLTVYLPFSNSNIEF